MREPPIAGRRLAASSEQEWNAEYDGGRWQHLAGWEERPRYWILAAAIASAVPSARVLDAGCGAGVLRRVLENFSFQSYTGLDISQSALGAARQLLDERTGFICADATTWAPATEYDAIVWNEILYYFDDPRSLLERYTRYLSDRGRFIVSLYRPRHGRQVDWSHRVKAIEDFLPRDFRVMAKLRLSNEVINRSWGVWVLEPKRPKPRG